MATKKYCCPLGKGYISIIDYDKFIKKQPFVEIVHGVENMSVSFEKATLGANLTNTQDPFGGESDCAETIIRSMNMTIETACLRGLIGQAALLATGVELTPEEVVEQKFALKGNYVQLSNIRDTEIDLVITSIDGLTTYVEDVDYEVVPNTGGMLIKILTAGTIPNGTIVGGLGVANIEITYTSLASERFAIGMLAGREFRVEYVGENTTGVASRAVFYRVRFDGIQDLSLITSGDDKATTTIDAKVLRDPKAPKVSGLYANLAELDLTIEPVEV